MILKDLFKKDYSRVIETVIKADDKEHIKQEMDEYVVTNEIARKLVPFFEGYTDKTSTNGVWISGFFGSGKSHLLKMLSYVLENKNDLGIIFADKIENDSILKGNILNSITNYQSESILFNIDQQAQITSKSEENAILQVFYKVFYDHLGFYGFQPHIAEFELYLQNEGQYSKFIELFEAKFSKKWVDARNNYIDPKVSETIAIACSEIFGRDAIDYKNFLDKFEDRNRQSIEDFAEKVNHYLSTKSKTTRLNFFVDEVGQYIAENTKLMLNLQTIAESLYTKCNGRSWIIVTSQEMLEDLVTDTTAVRSDDFSKIQGRFKIRIPLTSANIDEVIEKRLLDKNDIGKEKLKLIYKQEEHNLKTLLRFSGKGKHADNQYKSDLDFANKYPFIPYQFDLFQQCLISLSTHNVFQGRSQSVGERSMLGVFQEVLKGQPDAAELVSFDSMFEGIRGTLRTEAQNAIIQAENLLKEDKLAIRILKLLFLLKYNSDDIQTTTDNISIFLLDSYSRNINSHREDVENALFKLEQQTYIQRKGEIFEYLTNEEKDIEEEIKSTKIDSSELTSLLNTLIFDGIIGDNRIHLNEYNRSFQYSRIVNGVLQAKQQELEIEFVTQDYTEYANLSYFTSQTSGSTKMRIQFPEDRRLTSELRIYLQTDKFYRQKSSEAAKMSKLDILQKKAQYNNERKQNLSTRINELVLLSKFFINGTEYQTSLGSDAKVKIQDAFQTLVETSYTKLSLVSGFNLDESKVSSILESTGMSELFSAEASKSIQTASYEMLSYLQLKDNLNERASLSDIKTHFAGKPYGWEQTTCWCLLAYLYKDGKIESRQSTNILDTKQFIDALLNNRQHDSTLVSLQEVFDSSVLDGFKTFHNELYNERNIGREAKEIAANFKERADSLLTKLKDYLRYETSYPFFSKLTDMEISLRSFIRKDYIALLKDYKSIENELLDAKEDILDPIEQFWTGGQKKIYDRMNQFLVSEQANLDHIDAPELDDLKAIKANENPLKGTLLRDAATKMDQISARILESIDLHKNNAKSKVDKNIKAIKEDDKFEGLSQTEKSSILNPLEELNKTIVDCRFIGTFSRHEQKADELLMLQLNKMQQLIIAKQPKAEKTSNSTTNKSGSEPNTASTNTVKPELYMGMAEIGKRLNSDKLQLKSVQDVDQYIQNLRKIMVEQINKEITIIL